MQQRLGRLPSRRFARLVVSPLLIVSLDRVIDVTKEPLPFGYRFGPCQIL
jgi:hypothetical protein